MNVSDASYVRQTVLDILLEHIDDLIDLDGFPELVRERSGVETSDEGIKKVTRQLADDIAGYES